MGVNGIYGLSGSGLDVESMVKVGMLSKQSEYEKMQQKYTKDEWKKTEFISLYGEIQTFNASTLSQYKMSSNMNSRSATSANTSSVTATANANAATMTHYIEVDQLASSAYLIGTKSPTRLNTDASEKNQLSSVLFSSIKAGTTNDKVSINNVEDAFAMTDTAFAFSINDGVNGLLKSENSDAVVATATPDAATGEYTVKVSSMATAPQDLSASFADISMTPTSNFKSMLASFATANNGSITSIDYMTDSAISNTTALKFTVGDGTNSSEVEFKYSEIQSFLSDENFTMQDFIDKLNEKIGSNVNVTASISDSGSISFSNSNVGAKSKIIIALNTTMNDNAITNFAAGGSSLAADSTSYDAVLSKIIQKLTDTTDSDQRTASDGNSIFTIEGKDAEFQVKDENGITLFDNGSAQEFPGAYDIDGNTLKVGGIIFTAKKETTDDGVTITHDASTKNNSIVSVTYRELFDGFTFNDLTSKVNAMGLNVRFNYDAVQDRFSLYNKKSGEENQINIQFGTGAGATNAAEFFNKLGLQQSSNGTITSEALTFAAGETTTQKGVNASAKVDGMSYNDLDSNSLSVDGVTYHLQNVTDQRVAVTITQDTDTIIKNVESFISDYNALMTKLYKWYDEKPNSDYQPLTESQKSAMKDEQVEKWEAKAKAGMLYHDQTLWKIISDMRSAVTENVGGINGKYTNIFSIGVSTTGLKGQLTLDKDKLKAALAEDPDAVYNVFAKLDGGEKLYKLEEGSYVDGTWVGTGKYIWSANSEEDGYKLVTDKDNKAVTQTTERSAYNGIAQRLGDIFMSGMKSIKAVSGTSASLSEDSELNNLMRDLQTKMSNFKRMMAAFESRLYKKYDAMESSLALLGSQLNYVTSAFQ